MVNSSELRSIAAAALERYQVVDFPVTSKPGVLGDLYVSPRVTRSEGVEVPLEKVLQVAAHVLIVGDPGSGKTTLLKILAVRQARDVLSGKLERPPLLVLLRDLTREITTHPLDMLSRELERSGFTTRPPKNLLLLLDGLDEIPPRARSLVLNRVSDLLSAYPDWQVVLTSRPAGLSPAPPVGFAILNLSSFDSFRIDEFIDRLGALGKEREAEDFKKAIRETSFLQGLAQNPLLLRLIWEVFQQQNALPAIRAELYQTACDFLLSTWDQSRGIARQTAIEVGLVHDALAKIAYDNYLNEKHIFPLAELEVHLSPYVPPEQLRPMTSEVLSTGILTEVTQGYVSFVHLSFFEFYVARHLSKSPKAAGDILSKYSSMGAREVVVFAAGMLLDAGPLIEAAVERRELILAAKCLREGRTDNRPLWEFVVDEIARELGPEIIDHMAKGHTLKTAENIHGALKDAFLECRLEDLSPLEKGRRFESFSITLFEQSFEVVSHDLHTENGEIDLVVENKISDPFWLEFGGDILIECKNWSKPRPLKEMAAFTNKVRLARARLGFFVSASGLTEDALRTAKNQVGDINAPLIVPITGEDILRMLEAHERFDIFFKNSIRAIKHLHKY